jgi:hypothetical protein
MEAYVDRGTITPLWLGVFAVSERLVAVSDEAYSISACFHYEHSTNLIPNILLRYDLVVCLRIEWFDS